MRAILQKSLCEIVAPDPPVEARGALKTFYSNGSDYLKQLRDKGYVHIRGAISPETVAMLTKEFDEAIADAGFPGRFANPETIQQSGDVPPGFWGLDPVYLPFSTAAMKARIILREVVAKEAGVDPESLLASFDAVMATHPRYTTRPPFNPANPRVPMTMKGDKPNGPGHIDQCPDNTSTADAQQCFLTLTPADHIDMSTIVLAPRGDWTVQGMMDKAREKFPTAFSQTMRNPGDNGMMFRPEVQEWLIARGIAKAIKPKLQPGDVFIWSSAIPHCAGAATPPPGVARRPRLGIISGFYPADMVSEAAKAKRRKIVGGHRATGQQVHEPGMHMAWPMNFRWIGKDKWPEVYLKIQKTREDIRLGKRMRLYEDEDNDTEAEREHKRMFRSLLG